MRHRPHLFDITVHVFWICWTSGLLLGAVEGVQLIRSRPHVFATFPFGELAFAIATSALLIASFIVH